MLLHKSNNSVGERRKIKKPTNYFIPTSYSSIKKSNPQKVSGFIKAEDIVLPKERPKIKQLRK